MILDDSKAGPPETLKRCVAVSSKSERSTEQPGNLGHPDVHLPRSGPLSGSLC